MQVFDEMFKNPKSDLREALLVEQARVLERRSPSLSAQSYHLGATAWSYIRLQTFRAQEHSSMIGTSLVELPFTRATQEAQHLRLWQMHEALNAVNDYAVEGIRRATADNSDEQSLAAEAGRWALGSINRVAAQIAVEFDRNDVSAARAGLMCALGAAHVATARAYMAQALRLFQDLGPIDVSASCTPQREQLGEFVVQTGELISRLDEARLLKEREYVLEVAATIEAVRCSGAACAALTSEIIAMMNSKDWQAAARRAYKLANRVDTAAARPTVPAESFVRRDQTKPANAVS